MAANPWESMRAGRTENALTAMREQIALLASPSHIMELGVAYLWLGDYSAAFEHFQSANDQNPKRASTYYGMAGVAKWCQDEPDVAIQQWRDGLDCEYSDWAAVTLPLLLYFAALAQPKLILISEVEYLLRCRVEDPRARTWPGPLAHFVVGQIDETTLRRECQAGTAAEAVGRHWRADFYVGALKLGLRDFVGFRSAMEMVADVTWDDFDNHVKIFLHKLWCGELYLARHFAETK
jgi:tetratricopeptide (TPR) repeat protein